MTPPAIAPIEAPAPISPKRRFACLASKSELAKLQACTTALKRGVGDVLIANGRTIDFDQLAATRHAQGGTTQVVMR